MTHSSVAKIICLKRVVHEENRVLGKMSLRPLDLAPECLEQRREREKTNGLRKKKIISSHKCEATFDGATTSDLPSISLRGNSRSTVVVHAPHDVEFAGLNPTRFN